VAETGPAVGVYALGGKTRSAPGASAQHNRPRAGTGRESREEQTDDGSGDSGERAGSPAEGGNKRHFPFAAFGGTQIVNPAEFARIMME
jgi:hypothetical protein